jgi:hypothetical protein
MASRGYEAQARKRHPAREPGTGEDLSRHRLLWTALLEDNTFGCTVPSCACDIQLSYFQPPLWYGGDDVFHIG